jgi:hypothetical protein
MQQIFPLLTHDVICCQLLWTGLAARCKLGKNSICWLLDITGLGITREAGSFWKDAWRFDYKTALSSFVIHMESARQQILLLSSVAHLHFVSLPTFRWL